MKDATAPRPFVFVVMPFDDAFDDVYQLGIREACDAAGAYAERLDEQIFDESMLQRIFNQISKADLVVADMSGRNANVFYEVGYAHALGKRTILLTDRADDIPFDLRHHYHIVYEGSISTLRTEVEKRVRWMVENPTESSVQEGHQLEFFVGGRKLGGGDGVTARSAARHEVYDLQIDVHNSVETTIAPAHFELALVSSPRVRRFVCSDEALGRIEGPRGQRIHVLPHAFDLLPGGWEAIPFRVTMKRADPQERDWFTLRVVSADGVREIPFEVDFVE